MITDIQGVLAPIRDFRPIPWGLIPDLGLYMDQVVTFITRVYEPLYGEDTRGYVSPSMINNYVKSRLIPRPVGKKYSREQIALLLMIIALKQTCSMEQIRRLLITDGGGVEALYAAFCARFSQVIQSLCAEGKAVGAANPALDLAIQASGYSAGCAALLKSEAGRVQ